MRLASLGSGSKGNGLLVQDDDTLVLVDCGFTLKQTRERLARLGVSPDDLTAVLVTHEHSDHAQGVAALARKHGVPVFASHGTLRSVRDLALEPCQAINCHQPFFLGSLEVVPVPVPHDAREPVQFVFRSRDATLGVLTDLGHITPHVREMYAPCDALFIEFNHDRDMLANGPYPFHLKRRVGGHLGHLNNDQAAGLLEHLDGGALEQVVIGHISEKNNTAELALSAATGAVRSVRVEAADQAGGIDWVVVR